MSNNLKCPRCKSDDSFKTIEKLEAFAICDSIKENGAIDYTGESEMLYDSSVTIGVYCYHCDWEYVGDDWLDKLDKHTA
jgi:hypothetical protein